ncbi:hypothetical protein [Asticcacaulis sp. YBE204]|uniref:hypothetical protein n=1 Tax=Asticcacaulis sp. YBE204 TaxID=1282363 RepID=UPI0003C3BC17|nr:hypothetical protein [Asticcacaulis sp. YBE204]ESQ80107.1 hypothetical protein AEYBE204_05675 [Asticcacaulis sp. YBE204]
MNDKVFYSVAALIALGMITLSLVWPQGLGVRSPAPFGHEIELPDQVRAEREKAERKEKRHAEEAAERAARAQAQSEGDAASAVPAN